MSQKCKVCGKGVYPMDPQINLDGSLFHKPCAKCADCQSQITLQNFTKNESGDTTLLLCKTHYFKRFHEGGAYVGGEKFHNKTASAGEGGGGAAAPAKAAAVASIKNSTKCKICGQSVYPMDPQVNLDGALFHSKCAKCADCKCQINISNFTKNTTGDDTVLLCKTHYNQRFNEAGGSFLGGDKFQVKNARDVNAAAVQAAAREPVKASIGKVEITDADKQSDKGVFDFKAKDHTRRASIKLEQPLSSTNSPVKVDDNSSAAVTPATTDVPVVTVFESVPSTNTADNNSTAAAAANDDSTTTDNNVAAAETEVSASNNNVAAAETEISSSNDNDEAATTTTAALGSNDEVVAVVDSSANDDSNGNNNSNNESDGVVEASI